MAKEIERIFIAEKKTKEYIFSTLDVIKEFEIYQGYIVIEENSNEARIRKKTSSLGKKSYSLTIKGTGTLIREEIKIKIEESQFEELLPLTKKREFTKKVLCVTYEKWTLCLSLYDFDLSLLEIEFDSIEEARKFTPPDWFGNEVTEDQKYRGKWLAVFKAKS